MVHFVVEKSNVRNPAGHGCIWEVGLLYHFNQKFCINVDPEMYSPDSVSKVFNCPKNTIKFKLGLGITRFSIIESAGNEYHRVFFFFHHLE